MPFRSEDVAANERHARLADENAELVAEERALQAEIERVRGPTPTARTLRSPVLWVMVAILLAASTFGGWTYRAATPTVSHHFECAW